ncbi:coiled-coil domain-containing protein 51-like [Argonauta hians]
MAVRYFRLNPRAVLITARPLFKISRIYFSKQQSINTNFPPIVNINAQKLMEKYEEFIGLSDVKVAQSKVIESEKNFLKVQEQRRQKSHDIFEIQMNLRKINAELEKINRADDKYLALLTQEHSIIQKEASLNNDLNDLEKLEKELFTALSISVRESHEKERAQSEKTKYWSVIGSIIGALLGIIGTTINNKMRMKELRSIVIKSTDEGKQLRELTEKVISSLKTQSASVPLPVMLSNEGNQYASQSKSDSALVSVDLQKLEQETAAMSTCLKKQDKYLTTELKDIKQLIQNIQVGTGSTNSVIYNNPDIDSLMEENIYKLEQRMKLHSLASVTFIFAAFGLTLPVLYSIFRGN